MNPALIAVIGLIVIFALGIGAVIYVRKRVNPAKYREKWVELQKFCASKETWPLAIITADKLLDEAMRNKHFKGKTMGERLVSAQRTFKDNDGIWFAHNLAKKLREEATVRLRQADVKKSLLGIRQGLKDLGVME